MSEPKSKTTSKQSSISQHGESQMTMRNSPKTVGDYIDALSQFPRDWPVSIRFAGGGGTAIVQRDIKGVPHVAMFNDNGGDFGEKPLTEAEYAERSQDFLAGLKYGRRYTSIHGDHRLYSPLLGDQATCYGTHYDRRIVERMVAEGLIPGISVDIDRVKYFER